MFAKHLYILRRVNTIIASESSVDYDNDYEIGKFGLNCEISHNAADEKANIDYSSYFLERILIKPIAPSQSKASTDQIGKTSNYRY